ncbi:MAG TPA: dTMP kinase [Ktedonobacteraceae bacterium]
MSKGRLISFEGVDGAGKTTQIELLENWLKSRQVSYVRTREPGGTPLGAEIRHLLLNRPDLSHTITPLTETFLFQADRAQHFTDVVLPALKEGKLVITDRFFDASIAYQGYAGGVDVKLIEDLSLIATQGRVPDLTILLDLNPSQVHKRVGMVEQLVLPIAINTSHEEGHESYLTANQNGVREERNRLDVETQSFHRRVRDGFRALARAHPERIKVVDASRPIPQIQQKVISLIEPLLETD